MAPVDQSIMIRLIPVLAEALNVEPEEITAESAIVADLGAESIDFLDIVFRVEREFGIKIQRGELFPDPLPIHKLEDHKIEYRKVEEDGVESLQQIVDSVPQSRVKDLQVYQLAKFIQGKVALISG